MPVVEGCPNARAHERRQGPNRAHAQARARRAHARQAHARQARARARTLGLAALAAALVLTPAGCGSSHSSGTNTDPARVVPASARAYIGAVVRPGGDLQREALAAGRALTRQRNPYARLLGLLQTPGSPTLDYGRDVAPWLGPNGGLFLTSLGSSEATLTLLQQGVLGSGQLGWPFGSSGAQGAIVLDTSDLAKARAFVAGQAAHAGAHASAYQGVPYQAGSGAAFAVVDKLVVIGTEAGVRAVIETSNGGASLQSDATYAQLRSHAPSGELWHLYANPSAGGRPGGKGAATAELLETLSGTRPLDVSLVPAAKSLTIDANLGPVPAGAGAGNGTGTTGSAQATGASGAQGATGGSQGATGAGGTSATAGTGGLLGALIAGNQALGELPGESWLAAGLGNVGRLGGAGAAGGAGATGGLNGLLSLLGTLTGGSGSGAGVLAPAGGQATLSVKGLLEGMLTPLKIMAAETAQAKRQYRSWMGDAGIFVAGTTVLELKAGAVIESTDPAASRAAVPALARALRAAGAEASSAQIAGTEAAIEVKVAGLPLTLVIADGRASNGKTKFVLGIAESSIKAALDPPSPMSGASAYSAAQSKLGEGVQPSATVSFASLLTLLEGVGLSEDSTIAPLLPFLRNSTGVDAGGQDLGGGVQRLHAVLGLSPSSG